MKICWLDEVNTIRDELSALRQELHRHPELGNREFRTAETVERYLRGRGIETTRILDTAVVGELRGALPGPTVALRADMDALPVTEATGAPFASQTPGVMHACGHDVHTTALLGAARLLSLHRDTLRGAVRFLFQPDEEGSGGAARMIAAGCLDGVSAVFGAHVSPELPSGTVGVRYGKFYAASDTFDVTVWGKSAHGAEPEKGVDALQAAAEMVQALRRLPETFPEDKSVVTVGTFHAGTARNIISDRADFTGILRTLGAENRREMRQLLQTTLEAIAQKNGVRLELTLHESYPGVVNHDAMTRLAEETAASLLGGDRVRTIDAPTMTTEDFGYFLAHVPGAFYHVGAGCDLPLHNPGFLPDEQSFLTAAALHAAVAAACLEQV